MSKDNLRINDRIRVKEVRLIDENNAQAGIVDTHQALDRAQDIGLDLVEVAPNSTPPVCRIMDYGKYLYEQKRKTKLSQKKQHTVSLKEIRLRPKIDDHDRNIKVDHAAKFLEKGHKVQFTMLFRGREMMFLDHGFEIMSEIAETLTEQGTVERAPQKLGRRITMVMGPNKGSL